MEPRKRKAILAAVTLGLSGVALLYVLAWYVVAVRSPSGSTTTDAAMLLVHIAIPISAAMFVPVVFGVRKDEAFGRLAVLFIVFLVFIATAVMYAKSLEDLGAGSDYSPLPAARTSVQSARVWLLSGQGVIVLGCLGLLAIGGAARFMYFTSAHSKPMTNRPRMAVSVIVLIALAALWFTTERLVTRIDWWYFGTIDAFGWMVMSFLALPLMVVIFGLVIATADEATTKAVTVFCVTGLCMTMLASLAVEEFVHGGGLRAPHPMGFTVPLLGIGRVLANASGVRAVMAAIRCYRRGAGVVVLRKNSECLP